MAPLKTALLMAMSLTLVAGQRPSFAGSRPIGFPEVIKPTTESQLGNRFGEDETTTVRLPIEANGDRDLVDRLSKLPVDQQPFWLINWQALEAHRKNPQTFEQRPNVFVDPANSQSQNIQPQQTNTQQQMTQQQMLMQQLNQQQQQMMQQQVQQQQQMALEIQRRQQFEQQQQQQFMQQQQMNAQIGNSNFKPVISGFPPSGMKPVTTLNRNGEGISLHHHHRGNNPRTPTIEN